MKLHKESVLSERDKSSCNISHAMEYPIMKLANDTPKNKYSEKKAEDDEILEQEEINIDFVACEPSVEDEEAFDYDQGIIDEHRETENEDNSIDNKVKKGELSILETLPNNIEEKENRSGSLNSTKPHENKSVTLFSHDLDNDTKSNHKRDSTKESYRTCKGNTCEVQLSTCTLLFSTK